MSEPAMQWATASLLGGSAAQGQAPPSTIAHDIQFTEEDLQQVTETKEQQEDEEKRAKSAALSHTSNGSRQADESETPLNHHLQQLPMPYDEPQTTPPIADNSFGDELEAPGGGSAEEEGAEGRVEERELVTQNKHFFIMSKVGMPVYTWPENELGPIWTRLMVISAICSLITDNSDDLRTIYAGEHVMVFMARGPLYLVAISSSGEPAPVLQRQLEFIHSQIISATTSGITRLLNTRPHFDLSSLLEDSVHFIDHVVEGMDKKLSYLLNATQCLPLKPTVRSVVGTCLQGVQSQNLVYVLLIADGRLVSLMQSKHHPLQPEDLQIILDFVESSSPFRMHETWVPICLPKFNDKGYLSVFLGDLNTSTCLVLICTVRSSEKFDELAEGKQKVDKSLRAAGALDAITKSVSRQGYKASAVGVPGLVSFLYRRTISFLPQFTSPSLDPPYHTPAAQVKLLRRYQKLYAKALARPPCGATAEASGSPLPEHPFALRQYWETNDRESNLVWVPSEDVLLYVLFEPWVGLQQAVQGANEILKWVKSCDSRLFVLPAAAQPW